MYKYLGLKVGGHPLNLLGKTSEMDKNTRQHYQSSRAGNKILSVLTFGPFDVEKQEESKDGELEIFKHPASTRDVVQHASTNTRVELRRGGEGGDPEKVAFYDCQTFPRALVLRILQRYWDLPSPR